MVAFPTTQVGVANMNGLAELFRNRSTGRTVNDGDVRDIKGFKVDVSGASTRWERTTRTAVEPGKGVRTFTPETPATLLFPSALSAAMETQQVGLSRDAIEDARNRMIEGTPFEGMAISATVEVTQTETLPVEQVQGIGYYDRKIGSRAEDIDYLAGMLARGGELVEIERQLSAEFGEPVKLAWDAAGEEYLMLRPGQAGYDNVQSARQTFETDVNRTLSQMGYSKEDFRGVLSQYGVRV